MNETIRISSVANDSIVDGKGLRYTIFVQGCPHHCEGCQNPNTHDFNGGKVIEIDKILEDIKSNSMLDGITLSGGEPFSQAKKCSIIAKECKKFGLSVWCYTGFTYEAILDSSNNDWKELLKNIDVLVDGKFVKDLKSYNLYFKGSSNQRVIDIKRSLGQDKVVELDASKDKYLDKFTIPSS